MLWCYISWWCVTYCDVTYRDVTYRDVKYHDVTYRDVTYCDVTDDEFHSHLVLSHLLVSLIAPSSHNFHLQSSRIVFSLLSFVQKNNVSLLTHKVRFSLEPCFTKNFLHWACFFKTMCYKNIGLWNQLEHQYINQNINRYVIQNINWYLNQNINQNRI